MKFALSFTVLLSVLAATPGLTAQSSGSSSQGSVLAATSEDSAAQPFNRPPQKPFTVPLQKPLTAPLLKKDSPANLFARQLRTSQLFEPPEQRSREVQGAKVVYGLTLFPVNPSYDKKIRINVPERGVQFTIQQMSPTVCQQ